MKTYIVRALKYSLYLIVLLIFIFALMSVIKPDSNVFTNFFTNSRGLYMMIAVVVIFAAIYPFMGYVSRVLTFDASLQVDELVNVMSLCGYTRTDSGDAANMTFRATSKAKRFSMMMEDRIEIKTVDGLSTINGPRKEVVRATFRFTTFIG